MSFAQWFLKAFGHEVPPSFAEYLAQYPRGAENGCGPRLWPADRIQDETEERELEERGVCLVGGVDSLGHILMRARDGKIIMVDRHDYGVIDATFSSVDVMISLLQLEKS